jgi:hypothetical protein
MLNRAATYAVEAACIYIGNMAGSTLYTVLSTPTSANIEIRIVSDSRGYDAFTPGGGTGRVILLNCCGCNWLGGLRGASSSTEFACRLIHLAAMLLHEILHTYHIGYAHTVAVEGGGAGGGWGPYTAEELSDTCDVAYNTHLEAIASLAAAFGVTSEAACDTETMMTSEEGFFQWQAQGFYAPEVAALQYLAFEESAVSCSAVVP